MQSTLPNADSKQLLIDSPLGAAAGGLDACVHCGFCLQACPTYLALDDENDSPRGRLVLMRGLLDGELSVDDASVTRHIDRCLGCRACETACPAGVPYGHLLEATRETIAQRRPLPLIARIMLATFASPTLSRLALALGRVLRDVRLADLLTRLRAQSLFPAAMLAVTKPTRRATAYATQPMTASAERVALLTGCVMEGLYAHTNRATERVLQHNGYRIVAAKGQRCCGALHSHAGDAGTARELARANIQAFEDSDADYIAVNASGCGAAMKEYGHLLANDPQWRARAEHLSKRVRDASELLAAKGPRPGAPLARVVTYDSPCHLHHVQRIADAPLTVLRAIPSLTITPLADAEFCCGSAGIYNLLEPETSSRVLSTKLAHIVDTKAETVVTGNPGCLMQIGAGLRLAGHQVGVAHPIDLLDESYAAVESAPPK